MPGRFAAMYVRQMNLDERDADPRQCVPNGHAGVRVRGGIDQYEIESDKSGVVKEILVDNGQAVEYGQPLFVVG